MQIEHDLQYRKEDAAEKTSMRRRDVMRPKTATRSPFGPPMNTLQQPVAAKSFYSEGNSGSAQPSGSHGKQIAATPGAISFADRINLDFFSARLAMTTERPPEPGSPLHSIPASKKSRPRFSETRRSSEGRHRSCAIALSDSDEDAGMASSTPAKPSSLDVRAGNASSKRPHVLGKRKYSIDGDLQREFGVIKHRHTGSPRLSSSPNVSDVSRDPMDLLTATPDKAEQRLRLLGHSLPVSSSKPNKPSKSTQIELEAFTLGDLEAFHRRDDTTLAFASVSRRFEIQWYGGTQSVAFESDDIQNFTIQETQDPNALIARMEVRPKARCLATLSLVASKFDPLSSADAAAIFIKATPNMTREWASFATWTKSAWSQSVDREIIDSRTALRLFNVSAPKALHRRANIDQKKLCDPSIPEVAQANELQSGARAKSNGDKSHETQRRLSGKTGLAVEDDDHQLRQQLSAPKPTLNQSRTSQDRDDVPRAASLQIRRGTRRQAALTRNLSPTSCDGSDKSDSNDISTRTQTGENKLRLRFPFDGPGSVSVFDSDYQKLQDDEFLNDTIIEFGLKYHIQEIRDRDPDLVNSIYVYNSFFYRQLTSKGRKPDESYAHVRKWTSKIDIFSKDYLVIPINENAHWYLAIVLNPGAALEDAKTPEEAKTAAVSPPVTRRQREAMESASGVVSDSKQMRESGLTNDMKCSVAAADAALEQQMERNYSQLKIAEESECGNEGMEVDLPSCLPAAQNLLPHNLLNPSETIAGTIATTTARDAEHSAESEIRVLESAPWKDEKQNDNLSCADVSQEPARGGAQTVDQSSNILNHGKGELSGGGIEDAARGSDAQAGRRRPVVIVPGDSMTSHRITSPSQQSTQIPNARTRPRPTPTAASRELSEAKNVNSLLTQDCGLVDSSQRRVISREGRMDSGGGANGVSSTASRFSPGTSAANLRHSVESANQPQILQSRSRRSEEYVQRDRASLENGLVVMTFDSLGGKHPSVQTAISRYLIAEAKDKLNKDIRPSVKYINVNVPTQSNFCDCGLFVLLCECTPVCCSVT